MPRRRALTEAQLEDLLALPVSEPDLIRHWTLAAADLAMIDRRRGGHNQLGYAVQLCAFRYPGRLLRPGEAIPETALHFVADQLRVSADTLGAYAARPQTRREQLDDLREGFGFRMYAHSHGREMLAWLLPVALATTNAVTVAATLMDELRRRKILAPGSSVIERLIAAVLVVAERHVAGQLTRNLSSAQTEALDALLGPPVSFLRPAWRNAVRDSGSGGSTERRRAWEAATLLTLRDSLRSGDIWVAGSRQWRAIEDQLIPPALFAAMREAGPLPVAVPATAEEYLNERRALLNRRMGEIDTKAAADKLEDVRIKDDELKITPLKAIAPEEAEAAAERALCDGAKCPHH